MQMYPSTTPMVREKGYTVEPHSMDTPMVSTLDGVVSILPHPHHTLTLCILHRGLYFFHQLACFTRLATRSLMSSCTPSATSLTVGCMLTSEKKVKISGLSFPATCCGWASMQEPFSHRGNFLVLQECGGHNDTTNHTSTESQPHN